MSTPPLSTNVTPLPLSPVESPTSIAHTPTTIAFQSALPHLLQPLSPELSALHAARIRLLLELPVGSSRGWSCTRCGWLRDEFGWKVVKVKQEKGMKVVKTPDVPVKKGRARGKRGNDEADLQADISMPEQSSTNTNSVLSQSALQITAHIIQQPSTRPSIIGEGARRPSCKPAPRNRQKSTCPLCGAAISLRPPSPTTKAEFPSTRRTRAIVDANGGDVSVLPMANGMDGGNGRRSSRRAGKMDDDSGKGRDEAMDFESTGIAIIVPPPNDPSSRPSTSSGKTIISDPIKSSPTLAYIPLTDPDPATESLPSLTPSALPPPSGDRPAGMRNAVGYVNLGPVGGTGKPGKGKAGKKTSSLKTSTIAQAVSPPSGAASKPSGKSAGARATSSPKVKKTAEKSTITPNVKDTTPKPIIMTTDTTTPANPALPPTTASARGPPPKKKQKTGLAKLLADSKAREQESEKKRGTGLLSLGADWEL